MSLNTQRTYTGRSPRARGSQQYGHSSVRVKRSIPACAGKPTQTRYRSCPRRVDPRVRGEAPPPAETPPEPEGRSPRARGSLSVLRLVIMWRRSIPACAGKQGAHFDSMDKHEVDPRVRGEADLVTATSNCVRGRSPRARGSQQLPNAWRPVLRSIPACAGKPPGRRRPSPMAQVDPRVRGEARTSAKPQ